MTVQDAIELDRARKSAGYWQERYAVAVEALSRARTGMAMTKNRRALLVQLGDLKPGASLSARALSAMLGWHDTEATRRMLCELQGFGWVDSVPSDEKQKSIDVGYRLAHMAIAPESYDETAREPAGGLPLWQG